uniref:Mce/MlaD domain-containing protein n=1 Tax=Cliftonaea pectinata TaxID=2007206 RepID=A0A1Z1MQM0_9FLOR|nr:hypothetical protein [Cliftonaea pectinata]ARW68061.1 hypothetical protein [Cliftonaea pectinata]
MKLQYAYIIRHINKIISLLIFILIVLVLIFSFRRNKEGYKLFIEFNHTYSLKQGTDVNLRGVKIGNVKNINIQLNTVVVMIFIDSCNTIIPKNSIFEINQVGLFNSIVVDVIPLEIINELEIKKINVLSSNCFRSKFLCSNFYLKGYKGLNYDDLVRSTTRISQRFDDPRFFDLLYLLLYNSIEISDEIVLLLNYFSYFFSVLQSF